VENNKATLIIDDEEIKQIDMNLVAYESSEENISISFTEKKGFALSILNRETSIMNYYNIVDGKPVLTSRENILTGDETMMRDDILYKITELLHVEFVHIGWDNVDEGATLKEDLVLDSSDIKSFSNILIKEFDLNDIEFSNVMKWTTVEDVVDYIEDALECTLHDMEG